MNRYSDLLDGAMMATLDRLLLHLPRWLEALALLLVGWLLARLLRAAARRGAGLVDALIGRTTERVRWRIGRGAPVLGAIVYWVVLLFFATAASQALGLQTFTDWLARLLEHLPALLAGVLIMGAGVVLSGIVAELVQAAAVALPAGQRKALARVAQGATLLLALLVGADQIGLKVTWLAIFASLLLASVLGGAALAISLGARRYLSNVIGAHYLGQSLRVGQRLRVAGHEGTIVDITATSLVLETHDGRVLLPGGIYHEQALTVLADKGFPNER